jgi:hypothetical protein
VGQFVGNIQSLSKDGSCSMLPTWLAMLFLAVGHGFFLPLGPSGLLEGTLLLEQ